MGIGCITDIALVNVRVTVEFEERKKKVKLASHSMCIFFRKLVKWLSLWLELMFYQTTFGYVSFKMKMMTLCVRRQPLN